MQQIINRFYTRTLKEFALKLSLRQLFFATKTQSHKEQA